MTNEESLAALDALLAFNHKTGRPADITAAVAEVGAMADDCMRMVQEQMSNVPEPVCRTLYLLTLAIGTLTLVARHITKQEAPR